MEVSSVERGTSEEEGKMGDLSVYRVMPQSFEVPVFTHINPHLIARTLLCSVTKDLFPLRIYFQISHVLR